MEQRVLAHRVVRCALGAALLAGAAPSAAAQIAGLPVVQSPFPGRGVVVAVNGGSSDDFDTIGGAALFTPGSQRLSVTVGLGAAHGGGQSFTTAGARAAFHIPLGTSGRLGIAPFVGVGGIRADSVEIPGAVTPEGEVPRTSYSFVNVPIGASIGIRVPIGVTRAVTFHAAPSWQLWRFIVSGFGDTSQSYWRLGLGSDVSITERIGLSAAFETGYQADPGELGPTSNVWGVGVSYVFR